MEQKDPKDMTVSELMRWAATMDKDRYGQDAPQARLLSSLSSKEYYLADYRDYAVALNLVADKIDAELAQARRSGLERAAKSWAKANGWPDFRDGEDFGAWLDRCAIKRPCYEDGEPVRASREWNAIMMSLDGSRFKLLENYPDGLCFAGSPVKRPDPDTQDRIYEDAQKLLQRYWGCEVRSCKVCPAIIDGAKPWERYGVCGCDNAKTLDLLRRQRELDKRTGGAE